MPNKIILTDSCFWLGLIDSTDQHHEKSLTVAELIEDHQILLPWPCLYETVSTHLTRRRKQLLLFEQLISKSNIKLFDDSRYRDNAFDQLLFLNRQTGFTHSLTDGVLREILMDINVNVGYLVTYNNRDFIDICTQRQIEIID
ncbi:MAG: hypothetical protein KA713_02170 [Chryseotalea sp. WA131a]|jgi:predicted nucleic acid-binding protein|nr:MAG: hypothetical protein KA713_02170 [Chryseotalea sp. WA131a]